MLADRQSLVLRVFLSSPADVAGERALAQRLLKDEIPYDLSLHARITFDVVSWDDPAASIPMLANITPQEAVNRIGPKPSECDVVVMVLWSRLGTHLDTSAFRKPTGEAYLSGTEWEFEDAWNARPRPEILVYRRTEEPKFTSNDLKFEEKSRQYKLLEQFFARFKNPDGSVRPGVTFYDTPADFREYLANDLRRLFSKVIRLATSGRSSG